jgi:membrane protein
MASALTFDALLAAVPLFLLVLAGISWVLGITGGDPVTSAAVIERFFPPHDLTPGTDPFEAVEHLLARITEVARQVSVVAVPAFLWFSTRLFGAIRNALGEIYDVSIRPIPRHFIIAYLFGKLRDLGMVVVTLVLFLANAGLNAGLLLLQTWGKAARPEFSFFFTTAGRIGGEFLAFVFLVSLFFALYLFASQRRPPWRATLVASLTTAVLFEVAKRLFGFYVRNVVSLQQPAVDVNVGAIALFVVWMYYSALVFLLGGVVAETWELRELRRRQRMKFEVGEANAVGTPKE